MKNGLLITTFILFALAFVSGTSSIVHAMGAPEDNTITEVPTSDNATSILPAVNYLWQGASLQPASTLPSVTAEFIGQSASAGNQVTGNENWYLDIDINMPGWLYIAEYYPETSGMQSVWIAYKWQLDQSGLCRLGPFTPAANEAEGQHAYRLWFFSNGRWAADTGIILYWTYVRSAAPSPQPAQTVTHKEPSAFDNLSGFLTNPVVLLLGPSVIIVIVLVGVQLVKRQRREKPLKPPPPEAEAPPLVEHTGDELPSPAVPTPARAMLSLSNGMKIKVYGESLRLGRGELARTLGLDELVLISRRHLELTCHDGQFQIEDRGSHNGTRLNGEEIKEKGPVELKDGDVIEPAGATKIKFQVL